MCALGERISTPLNPFSTLASAAQHSQLKAHRAALTPAEAAAHTGFVESKGEAYERADVFPKIEGNVVKIHVVEGAVVKAGDVLAELECEEDLSHCEIRAYWRPGRARARRAPRDVFTLSPA